MVTENSSSVITLTPCTIIKLYHEEIFQEKQFNLINCFRRLFFLPLNKQLNISPMTTLASSIRLSNPLIEEKTSNPISTSSITKLYKYSQETEIKSYVDSNGTIRQYRQSTERALLAQRKIYLRKKLGEGSFSSVREGFDLFHQYKVAIKVEKKIFCFCEFCLVE